MKTVALPVNIKS